MQQFDDWINEHRDEIQQNAVSYKTMMQISRYHPFLYYFILIAYAIQPAWPNLQNLPKISVYIYIKEVKEKPIQENQNDLQVV